MDKRLIVYKGEDIILNCISDVDLIGYTLTAFCFVDDIKQSMVVTIIDGFNFKAWITSINSSNLSAGSLNVVFDLQDSSKKLISKSVQAILSDPYSIGDIKTDDKGSVIVYFIFDNQTITLTVNYE